MTDLVNNTLVTETGIALCKPDIYSLNVVTDDAGNKSLCLLHMGTNIVQFDIDDDVRKKLIEMLSTSSEWEELLDQRARELEAFKERGLPVPSWASFTIK